METTLISSEPNPETVQGTVERILFRNADSDWAVLLVKLTAPRRQEPQVVVGHTHAQPGQEVTAHGNWKNNASFGLQFVAQRITAIKPSSTDGIARYLGSGLIPGIGPSAALSMVETFGEGTIAVLDEAPERLTEVPGIGKKKAAKIASAWNEQKAVAEIMLFLNEHDIAPHLCRRIYKRYEDKAIHVIREDPYRLALEVPGIGFKTADTIAAKLQIPKASMQRVRAGLVYLMQQASSSGHCGIPKCDLLSRGMDLLEIDQTSVVAGLAYDLELVSRDVEDRNTLVEYDGVIYLSWLSISEEIIAHKLKAMAGKPAPWESKFDIETEIAKAENDLSVKLATHQRAAVRVILSNKVCVMTGGPGTGKTTTLRIALHILQANRVSLALCAPTGKAAKRASEATGIHAQTIHRLIGLKPGNANSGEVDADVIVADETSMLDVSLTKNLLGALRKHAALVFVGDVDQLPSVGPGQVLADVIASGVIPVVKLTEVFRQAAGSLIIRNAHRINTGGIPEQGAMSDDFFVIPMKERDNDGNLLTTATIAEHVVETISELVVHRLPTRYGFDPIRDIQVLSPMSRTTTGVNNLNTVLQQQMNPNPAKAITLFGTRYGLGDKVIQTRNNYDLGIFNGDMGIVSAIDEADKTIAVEFDGKPVVIPFDDISELRLAYAMTIHKSQGSEAPAIVIPVTTQHFTMLQRNLLYTGVTRAKRLVILVGQWKAIGIAVKNDKAMRRVSRLRDLLQH
jgi:exodeoxyribonuclease V alpha subunit